MPISKNTTNLGQIVEYIPDRLYLAAYVHPPTADTLFPYSDTPVGASSRSPSKRTPAQKKQPFYFSVDDSLLYNAFHHDFGPLHIGHLYRFALYFHEVLAAKENKDRPIVFWSKADPRSELSIPTPFMPFRDAGYSQADYGITVQDVVYGVWKAKEEGVVDLENFDLDQYERFERVEHGDFNWITPNFLAFASPSTSPTAPAPMKTVRKFIRLVHDMITNKKKNIAVHCKAGLGRTGCLIGAYLIYRHGFTANEVIAFMRFMRPGMVVGPQQHWLHIKQGTFRDASNRTPLSEPRKAARTDRHHPYGRTASASHNHTTVEEETGIEEETEIVAVHRTSHGGAESDEEIHLRVRAHRKASQTSRTLAPTATKPVSRVVSTPAGVGSTLAKVRGSQRRDSPLRSHAREPSVPSAGVRKTSGRMGSVSAQPSATARKVSGGA
ncbi:unnamed protein product [Parascedosporium putredinis]|uniref:Tyrosine specific protein phosphatases domain-containing protein n=1 Tax=Parascedosporium putredinis TaxID=1442378 RepID=A0A9P1H4N5_9PEZI|nr:unnamed protein product [Parascedosporium putredinis]CAI7998456.1 unnamed protein product [Parascedosporium putredinis]